MGSVGIAVSATQEPFKGWHTLSFGRTAQRGAFSSAKHTCPKQIPMPQRSVFGNCACGNVLAKQLLASATPMQLSTGPLAGATVSAAVGDTVVEGVTEYSDLRSVNISANTVAVVNVTVVVEGTHSDAAEQ